AQYAFNGRERLIVFGQPAAFGFCLCTLGPREILEGEAQRRMPRALPFDGSEQKTTGEESQRNRNREAPRPSKRPRERRRRDAGEQERERENEWRIRDVQAERSAGEETGGGNHSDGPHAGGAVASMRPDRRSMNHEDHKAFPVRTYRLCVLCERCGSRDEVR